MAKLTFKKIKVLFNQEVYLNLDIAEQVPATPGIVLVTVGNRVEVCDSSLDLPSLVSRTINGLRYCMAYAPRVFIVSTEDYSELHSSLITDGIMSLVLPQSEIKRDYSQYL